MTNINKVDKSSKTLIVIVGPTAIGKTSLSIEIAKLFNTEIVSADSRQFFKELSIGTAKPDAAEMQGIPHHFINSHSIEEEYNVNDYEQDALKVIEQIFDHKNLAILVGGSGLYIDALCYGLDEGLPDADMNIRKELNEKLEIRGIEALQQQLKMLDPEFYEKVDLNNSKRLLRALEVCLISGKTFTSFRKGIQKSRPFNILKIGLEMDREALYDRINQRVDNMMEKGLLKEVKSVEKYRHQNALKTVGYRELFDFLDEKLNKEEAIDKIKINSRRYAKRQMTWFKKDENTIWFNVKMTKEIITFIESSI